IIFFFFIFFFFTKFDPNFPEILQLDPVVSAEEGDDVILPCFHPKEQINNVLWYKQLTGQKPVLLASSYYRTQPFKFYNDFDMPKRFDLLRADGSSNLSITSIQQSDSAVYYCAVAFSNIVSFGAGTVLLLKGHHSNKYTVQQLPVPHLLYPKDSVTLQCSVITNICAGDHSVYWFRHGSGESDPGIIFTHGNRSDQCKKSSETVSPTQSCIYKLPKNNLSLSDAGSYYCAVAACGEILYGNGTKLNVKGKNLKLIQRFQKSCYCLVAKINYVIRFQIFNTVYILQYSVSNEMNYAALKFNTKTTKMKRGRNHEETVYSGVARQSYK
uniref:Ig-like domain-containing protein n=1 Tax=Astyanax mexicanus TaxID=7994 RepID=W5K1P7_ASTMX